MEIWALTPKLVDLSSSLITEYGELGRQYKMSESNRVALQATKDPEYKSFDSCIYRVVREHGPLELSEIANRMKRGSTLDAISWNSWRLTKDPSYVEKVLTRRLQNMRTNGMLLHSPFKNKDGLKGWTATGNLPCKSKESEIRPRSTRLDMKYGSASNL